MYAVIRTGGKQYGVEPGAVLDIEQLPGAVGDDVDLSDVLLLDDGKQVHVGKPLLEGISIQGQILAQKKAPKVTIFKKIRRHGKQLKKGHRQSLTSIKITNISETKATKAKESGISSHGT